MSSSAVYQVSNGWLSENSPTGFNPHWQDYGLNKLAAEQRLLK